MTKPVSVTTVYKLVTPEMASAWLTNYLYAGQRTLRPHHVTLLADAMRRNQFLEGTAITFAIVHGQRMLINGQHTLHAIIASGCTIRLAIQGFQVDSLGTVAELYGKFDIHMRRSAADIYSAYDFAQKYGLSSQKNVGTLGASMLQIISGFLPAARGKYHPINIFLSSTINRMRAMTQWVDYARAYFECFIGNSTRRQWEGQRAGVAAVGILTFRYQPAAAETFWNQVSKREMLTQDMPAYRLANYLEGSQGDAGRSGFLYARGVAAAWNAFFEGRSLSMGIKPRRADLPMMIKGTPLRGVTNLAYFQADPDGKGGTLLEDPIEVITEKSLAE